MPTIRKEFASHTLNETGAAKVAKVAELFSALLDGLEELVPVGRERSIVITDLEKAKMVAVVGIARHADNQAAT